MAPSTRKTRTNNGGPTTPPRISTRARRSDRSAGTRCTLPLDSLHDRRDPLPDADAHRREAPTPAGPDELVAEHRDQPRPAHPERMAEGDRPAVDVDLRRIQTELVDANERLRRERLVQLDQIEVADRDSGPLECLARRRNRSVSHDRRVDAGDRR